jgi:hypothetical protein
MKVLDFIRSNEYWEEALAAPPYCIKAVHDEDYVLLKYNQLESDFNNDIVRECRGCIMRIPQGRHDWADVVCYPFDKFGNYGESYAPAINWHDAVVLEKVDGSLIKVWWGAGEWHVSTNGTIDARKAPTSVEDISFYDIFIRALEKNGNPRDFFNSLDPDYTYMFELVSPETRVTIDYQETAIYYLGARNIFSLEEVKHYWFPANDGAFSYFIKTPKQYPLTTLEECIDAVNKMSRDEEGFVVCDNQFNRVKIKSPEYLIAAHLRNNGVITTRRVIEMMRANQLDDFCAYAPQYKDFVDRVLLTYKRIGATLALWYAQLEYDRAANTHLKLHEIIQSYPAAFRDYCYKRYANRVSDPYEYLNKLTLGKLVDWIKEYGIEK